VIRDAVVVGGSADINGSVSGKLVMVLCKGKLGPSADVKGELVAVGGAVEVDPAARIGGDRVFVGTEVFGIGTPAWLRSVGGWIGQGLLMGRPLVPQHGSSWVLAAFWVVLCVLLGLLFPRLIQACADSLEQKPGSSLMVGLLALLLSGPVLVLCVISVVGIVAVPFAVCALVAGSILGTVGVYQYTGFQLQRFTGVGFLQHPLLAIGVGAVVFVLLYCIPVLGLVALGGVGSLAIGCAVLALFRSLRVEGGGAKPLLNPAPAAAAGPGEVPPVTSPAAVTLPRVGFWWRLFAALLDVLLIGFITRLVSPGHGHPDGATFLLLWLAYHVGLWTWKGATLGDLVLSMKLVRQDGAPVDFGVALIRALACFFSALPAFLGFFWAGWDPEKQAWHDKIAGTLMVKAPRSALAF
jgi:uncharacterized RDD family membrane protein YckC